MMLRVVKLELYQFQELLEAAQRSRLVALKHQAGEMRKSGAMTIRYETLDAFHVVVVAH